ncbi:MAG: HDOD domain-containing protein [Sulfuricurvum sp.]|nr:HDOD domain-containing protein [Sulfuricurvum sp.]MDD5386881.1 HDOD domain-containing protein [Sulfuricurvum sp.]
MFEEIKSFPPLPESIAAIQDLCMMRDVNISALTNIIENDPMLSANILKSVNSPLYGMSKEVSSIHQAVILFGVSMIRGFAAANAIKKTLPLDLSPYNTTIEKLTEVSTLQLALLREWYGIVDKERLPSLLCTTFLMELGKLVIAQKVIKSGKKEAFLTQLREGKALSDIEKSDIGYESYEIASMMFEQWNFESSLVETLRSIHNPNHGENGEILNVISCAITIHDALTKKSLENAFHAIEIFGLDKAAFEKAVETVKTNMER